MPLVQINTWTWHHSCLDPIKNKAENKKQTEIGKIKAFDIRMYIPLEKLKETGTEK